MEILAHRGFWKKKNEQNKLVAFKRAINSGFGIETDIRDFNGKLVISHSLPDTNSIKLSELLKLILKSKKKIYLALNVKSDGLLNLIKKEKDLKKIEYFLFDMSVPQQKIFDDNNLKYFIRISEIEKNFIMSKAKGAWVDSFFKIWYNEKILKKIKYSRLVIVSSELHKRMNYRKQWNMLRSLNLNKKLLICTDYPDKANHFFNDKK